MGRELPVLFSLAREALLNCVNCGFSRCEVHHIRSRGAGGQDDDFNLVPLCRKCHTEIHMRGAVTFTEENKKFRDFVESKGWTIETVGDRKRLVRSD